MISLGSLVFLTDTLAAPTLGGYVESKCILRCSDTHFEQCQEVCGPLASHYSSAYAISRTSILEEVLGFQDFVVISYMTFLK